MRGRDVGLESGGHKQPRPMVTRGPPGKTELNGPSGASVLISKGRGSGWGPWCSMWEAGGGCSGKWLWAHTGC